MCGLIAAFDTNDKKKPVNDLIINMYEEQYRRGEEGFGIVSINKNQTIKVERSTEPVKFMYDIYNNKSPMIFAHHRTPTSTANKLSQTHPILIENNILKFKYLIMHNGVIRNCDELKKKHEEIGFIYTTEIVEKAYMATWPDKIKFNDSESMAIELAMYIEGKKELVEFEGSAAFLVLQIDKKTNKINTFYYGRHLNPLNIERNKGVVTIASEGPGVSLKEDIVYAVKLTKGAKVKEYDLCFPVKVYPTTMPSPIYNQSGNSDLNLPITKTIEANHTEETVAKGHQSSLWTAEDEKEMEEYNQGFYPADGLGIPQDESLQAQYIYEEISTMIEDFCMELEEEDTAYEANIEETLMRMKGIMKELKGDAIRKFREIRADKTELQEAMGFKTTPKEEKVETNNKVPFPEVF